MRKTNKVYITLNTSRGWKVIADGKRVDCGHPLYDSCDASSRGLNLCKEYCANNNLSVIRECK